MSEDEAIDEKILEIAKVRSPPTVKALVEEAAKSLGLQSDVVLKRVVDLQDNGKLSLILLPENVPRNMSGYALSSQAYWFWVVTAISLLTIVSTLLVGEKAYPLIYGRYALGFLFICFLPGYSLTKLFFPAREMGGLEKLALSIGLSLAIVPFTVFILDYLPVGVRATPIAVSLSALTLCFSGVALLREHSHKVSEASISHA